MASPSTEAGRAFLQRLLAKVPEASRSAVEAALSAAEAEPALQLAGEEVLARSDYSRHMDAVTAREAELDTYKGTLDTWYVQNKAVLDAARGRHPNPNPNLDPTPTPNPKPVPDAPLAGYVTEEDHKRAIAEVEQGGLGVMTAIAALQAQHFQHFGTMPDIQALLKHPKVQQIGLKGAYDELYKPDYDKKAEEAKKAERDQIREEERAALVKANANLPYPSPSGTPPPSTLDGLIKRPAEGDPKPTPSPASDLLERSVALYEDLTRPGQPGGSA